MKKGRWINNRSLLYFLLTVSIILSYAYNDLNRPASDSSDPPALTYQSREHILYGDGDSGGHRHSVGTPCKTEFPSYWDEEKILNTVELIAANDNLPWRMESNGYEVVEDTLDGVEVRVVVDPRRNEIVTAYPTNLPRNPCPANDG